jgi:hypothetical protein
LYCKVSSSLLPSTLTIWGSAAILLWSLLAVLYSTQPTITSTRRLTKVYPWANR